MQAIITVYRRIGDPWYKVQPQPSFIYTYALEMDLEKHCLELAAAADVAQICAFDINNLKILVDLYKSEKKPVIIYKRSKFPR